MKRFAALLVVISLLMLVTGCNTQSAKVPENKGYVVADSRGKDISFTKAPEKIISLLPSDTEIIYALGVGDKVIAVSKYCNYPEDTKNKQKLDSGNITNIESIIGLKPDVVFMGQMEQTVDQFKQLEDAGVKIFVTKAGNIEDTYKVIGMVGKALNNEAKATDIVNGMKKDFDDLKNKAKNNVPKKVYIEISPLQSGLWSCGKGTFQNEICEIIGANNIFSDVDSWKQVAEEQVISRNPEYILTTVGEIDGVANPVAEIKSRANWNKIDAVKNNKVFVTDGDALIRPGPRLVQAAKDLMKLIYG